MAARPDCKIVNIAPFVGPKTSPSDSPPRPPVPPDRHPVRQARLVMRRFLVRRFYRRRDRGGYWYARVMDLQSGKTFRMSSREKNLKKAEKLIPFLLRLKEVPPKPGERHPLADHPMFKAVSNLTGEEIPPPPQTVLEFVKEGSPVWEVLEHLTDRAEVTITPEELEDCLRRILSSAPEPEGPLFEVAFEEYLKTKDVRPSTLQGYDDTGRLFQRFLKRKHVHEITGLDIQKFIDSFKRDGKAQRTRQKHLNCLRSFFRWTRDVAKYVKEDPTVGIKVRVLKSQRRKKRKGLTVEEARRLLSACRVKRKQKRHDIQHLWMAIFISLRTGLRLDNVLDLTWSRVDLEQGVMHVRPEEYKTDRGDDLTIPIHAELWRVLRLWKRIREKSPLVTDRYFVLGKRLKQIIGPFKGAAKRAGVVTDFHNLRHAFETWLVDHDVPSPVQKDLMGHSPGSVTEGYAHPSLEKMRECVNRLPRLLLPTKDE